MTRGLEFRILSENGLCYVCSRKKGADQLRNFRLCNMQVSKFNVGFKSLLHQGLSEPEFYGDLVYKFKKIMGRTDFSDQFRKIMLSLQTYWL